jgi:hypothetical protein
MRRLLSSPFLPFEKSLLVAGCFLLYWVVGHSRIWGVEAPLGTGLVIATALGLLAFVGPGLQRGDPVGVSSMFLIALGILGTVLLGRLAMINSTENHTIDVGIAVGLLILPITLLGTGISQLTKARRSARPR